MVTQADAHSWPELYFPGIGWVPFEPTASRPVSRGSVGPNPEALPTPPALEESGSSVKTTWPRYVGFAGLATLLLGGAGWAAYDEAQLRRQEPRRAAAEIYRRLRRYGKALGVDGSPGETPSEYSQALNDALLVITSEGSTAMGRGLVREASLITGEIVRLVYRPQNQHDEAKQHILSQWRSMRWRLRWISILHTVKGMRQLIRNWLFKAAGGISEQA
jgi:hypothetical protein